MHLIHLFYIYIYYSTPDSRLAFQASRSPDFQLDSYLNFQASRNPSFLITFRPAGYNLSDLPDPQLSDQQSSNFQTFRPAGSQYWSWNSSYHLLQYHHHHFFPYFIHHTSSSFIILHHLPGQPDSKLSGQPESRKLPIWSNFTSQLDWGPFVYKPYALHRYLLHTFATVATIPSLPLVSQSVITSIGTRQAEQRKEATSQPQAILSRKENFIRFTKTS